MKTFVRNTILAATAAGALAASVATASADGVGFGIFFGPRGEAGVQIGIGTEKRGDWMRGMCSNADALDKAASMGVRKRWIAWTGENRVAVRGRMHGQQVQVVMRRNSADCSVRSLDYV